MFYFFLNFQFSLFFGLALRPSSHGVLANFLVELIHAHAKLILAPLLHYLIDVHVLCNLDALVYGVILLVVIVYQWFTRCIYANAHLGLDQCLRRAHVPVLETWDKVDVIISHGVEHENYFVAGSGDAPHIHRIKRLKQFVHLCLIPVQRATQPEFIIFRSDAHVLVKWCTCRHSLQSPELGREAILDKNPALWRAKVGALHMNRLVVEWLMNNTGARPLINRQANHTGDVV